MPDIALLRKYKQNKTRSLAFSQLANYTYWEAAAGRPILVQNFANG